MRTIESHDTLSWCAESEPLGAKEKLKDKVAFYSPPFPNCVNEIGILSILPNANITTSI